MLASMLKVLLGLLVLAVGGLAGFAWLTLHWAYSDGERAGYVQKLSRKGWLCKTWEGEMAMVTMPGTVSEKFALTVPDGALLGHRAGHGHHRHLTLPGLEIGRAHV